MKYRQLQHSFDGYLQDIYLNTNEIEEQTALLHLKKISGLIQAKHDFLPLFYIIDYTRRDYVLFSDTASQVVGHSSGAFLEGGLDILRHFFHKDDFRIYNEEIFARNCTFLTSVPQQDHADYLFSYTFRWRNEIGQEQTILQRGSYITAPATGLPLYSLGLCTNISLFKEGTRMVHTIEKRTNNGFNRHTIEQNYFYPNEEDRLFTLKETEVLFRMADGWSIKQIANLMRVADTTIITHRKNMMQKSNTKNAVELVAWALRNQLI